MPVDQSLPCDPETQMEETPQEAARATDPAGRWTRVVDDAWNMRVSPDATTEQTIYASYQKDEGFRILAHTSQIVVRESGG